MVSWVPGMRWVCYVRVAYGSQGHRFYAVGTGHRWPCTVALSRRQAAELAGVVPFIEALPPLDDATEAEHGRTDQLSKGPARQRRSAVRQGS